MEDNLENNLETYCEYCPEDPFEGAPYPPYPTYSTYTSQSPYTLLSDRLSQICLELSSVYGLSSDYGPSPDYILSPDYGLSLKSELSPKTSSNGNTYSPERWYILPIMPKINSGSRKKKANQKRLPYEIPGRGRYGRIGYGGRAGNPRIPARGSAMHGSGRRSSPNYDNTAHRQLYIPKHIDDKLSDAAMKDYEEMHALIYDVNPKNPNQGVVSESYLLGRGEKMKSGDRQASCQADPERLDGLVRYLNKNPGKRFALNHTHPKKALDNGFPPEVVSNFSSPDVSAFHNLKGQYPEAIFTLKSPFPGYSTLGTYRQPIVIDKGLEKKVLEGYNPSSRSGNNWQSPYGAYGLGSYSLPLPAASLLYTN